MKYFISNKSAPIAEASFFAALSVTPLAEKYATSLFMIKPLFVFLCLHYKT